MKLAVTGGAGFIGSYITRNLIKNGHSVIVIDNLHTGKLENLSDVIKNIEFHKIDIRNYEKIHDVLKKVDGVFHEAALTVVPESFHKKEEYVDVNVNGTKNIFEIAKELGIKVVYASSSSVYGNTTKIPIKEDYTRVPINPYGMTKLEDELMAEKFSNNGLEVIGLRYFNVYGIGQTGSYAGVITQFLRRLRDNLSPIIYGDGTQIRDFVHVKDVAKVNLMAMEKSVKKGFFNIGTGKPTSILELANLMIKLSKINTEPIFSKKLDGDVHKSQAETSFTKDLIGWEYEIELDKGLEEMF